MKVLALPVAISALIHENRILLIRRERGNFVGLWGLPGGKIENNEHLAHAAVREILEESGIESEFRGHLALVSEHVIEDGKLSGHFLLHVCELSPRTTEITRGSEGKLAWFDLDTLHDMRDRIIPSDFPMIERIVRNRESAYYESVIEKSGDNHTLRRFEPLSV